MSIGVGDAIAITEIIINVYKVYKGTPKEIIRIGESAEETRDKLTFLDGTIGQTGSLIHSKQGEKMHVA